MGKAELKLEIDQRLLDAAKAADVSLEDALEAGVRQALGKVRDHADADARAKRWAEENAEGISDYNRRIEERGVFGADLRRW